MDLTILMIVAGAAALILMGVGVVVSIEERKKIFREVSMGDEVLVAPPPPPSPLVKGVFLLIPLGIAGLGIVVLGIAGYWWMSYDASQSWPSVPGRILRADISSRMQSGDSDDDQYTVFLEYTYTVNGVTYTNDRIYFSRDSLLGFHPSYDHMSQAQKLISPYAAGGTVTVYYDPRHPDRAVLERRIDEMSLAAAFGSGAFGLLVGLMALILGIKQVFKRPASSITDTMSS